MIYFYWFKHYQEESFFKDQLILQDPHITNAKNSNVFWFLGPKNIYVDKNLQKKIQLQEFIDKLEGTWYLEISFLLRIWRLQKKAIEMKEAL